ncbi:plasma protease C1 inhibitor-like [Zerene cesonia]|uniref:plasma protease C1 inhibitor-like n=1 Tax=Zerene cesonia TaxID=33412 RepID=UPI0018E58FCD|nr:plasma protease C1 inhibitor-like [Zerene cesonia]
MRLLLVIFLVPCVLCGTNFTITQDLLEEVFGKPQSLFAPAAAPPSSVLLQDSGNSTIDLGDLDSIDIYTPSIADYDRFDWTLTKRVAVTSNENFLISPLGLKLALAILTEAASGPTQAEIASVLGLDLDYKTVRQKFAAILDSLQTKSSQYILDLGSRIYVGASVQPRQRFSAIAQQFYKTEITSLDFSQPILAAHKINEWVNTTTQGRIPNLVTADDVQGVVALVLNTLFFKGTWWHQFTPNETHLDNFYVNAVAKKPVEFMHVKNKFYYTDSVKYNAKILRMPYLGHKFAMYVIVPNSLTGLPIIFNDISGLRAELSHLKEHLVDVSLPKFHFEYTSVLDGVLKELGIRQAFEDTASFPGIARGQTLKQRMKISKVLQRSGIEVNELGSVAYSATEISLVNKFGEGDEPTAEVFANKPFMFFIQDEPTTQLLFTGRVSDPTLVDGALKTLFLLQISKFDCLNGGSTDFSRLNFFDIDLLRYTAEDKPGNVMVSPASIKSVLAMVLEGAQGSTEDEIRSALRLSSHKDEFREHLNSYLSLLRVNSPGVMINNANAAFVSNKLKLRKDFEVMLQKVYLASVRYVDYGYPYNVSEIINHWVNENTKGLIPGIVDPANISPMADMILANAIYFKGTWANAFNPRYTRSGCFHHQGKCRNVAMMELHSELNYAYVDNLRAHAVELPYEGGQYSMILLVPLDREGCAQLIRDLPYMSLPQISLLFEPTDIRLIMPKFTVDYNENMVGPLRKMRIESLFSRNANLSGMFEGISAQVENIVHKVHMSVDEKGTVAAASSVAMVIPLIGAEVLLQVDRPFVFYIRDNKKGLVLFEGKIDEPNVVEDAELQKYLKNSGINHGRRYSNPFF